MESYLGRQKLKMELLWNSADLLRHRIKEQNNKHACEPWIRVGRNGGACGKVSLNPLHAREKPAMVMATYNPGPWEAEERGYGM